MDLRPIRLNLYRNSSEADTDAVKPDTGEFGRRCLAGRHRKRTRQSSRRDDLAACEWRIDLIARENIDEITQCRHGATQYIRSATTVDDCALRFRSISTVESAWLQCSAYSQRCAACYTLNTG